MECWDPKTECMSREEIAQVQLERLQATLNRVFKNVRHYRQLFREMDVMPEDIQSISDISRLPFTTRDDLKKNYPYGMFATPLREVVRLHAPAVNIDKPVVMGFTANDVHHWGELMARKLTASGVTKDDVVQVSLPLGKLSGPFGIQLGAERIGASVIPLSPKNIENQVQIMRDFRTTTLVSTPTFALSLKQTMDAMEEDSAGFVLKQGIFGSEPWPESLRNEIETDLNISAYDSYGLAEIFGPGLAWECSEKKGLHIPEDHFYPEVIDPDTGAVLPEGEYGELVLTTLSKEAFPLVRFRTGDITAIRYQPCGCGRTHCRIERIKGRVDDVVVMRGTCVIPSHVGIILERHGTTAPVFQLVVERQGTTDFLSVLVAISDDLFFDEMRKQRQFVETLNREMSNFLGWDASVKLVEPDSFDPDVKVVDHRPLV